MKDKWAAGSMYEGFMGRWSRTLGPKYIDWLGAPEGARWLEVGCGTGSLTRAICESANPSSVVACDPTETFVEHARENVGDPRVSFVTAGAGSLPSHPEGFECVASSLVLNFLPDPEAGVIEMRERTSPGGVVSACVWDYAGKMEFLRYFWDAVNATDPSAAHLDEGRRFAICNPDALVGAFERAGFGDVACEPIEIPTRFANFDDYWKPFLVISGPAPTYVTSLDEDRRQALSAHLEKHLPRDDDGSIPLVARAWAVRGTVRR